MIITRLEGWYEWKVHMFASLEGIHVSIDREITLSLEQTT